MKTQCKNCHVNFSHRSGLNKHRRNRICKKEKNKKITPTSFFECPICDLKLSTRIIRLHHVISTHKCKSESEKVAKFVEKEEEHLSNEEIDSVSSLWKWNQLGVFFMLAKFPTLNVNFYIVMMETLVQWRFYKHRFLGFLIHAND